MRTKKFWDNRYNNFSNKILGEEIEYFHSCLDAVKNEIIQIGEFFKEYTENGQYSAEEIVLYCYINHELNVLDPIGCCYPQISNEYSSYAWKLVDFYLKEGKEKFPAKVKKQVEDLVESIGFNMDKKSIKNSIHNITNMVNEIDNSQDFIKKLHKEQFSGTKFWKSQFRKFQYKVLGDVRKEYAASIVFLQEERDHLLKTKEENMMENYEDFVQFLYINHHLNLLDPSELYYPQFYDHYEDFAWEILNAYRSHGDPQFPVETEKIIVSMFENEGCAWKRKLYSIRYHIEDIKKALDEMNKQR